MDKSFQGGIGVFDSGMGGLDVAAAISKILPHEQLIYLGDNARVPYGTKSASTVRSYTKEAAYWLVQKGIKALVIACNTASAAINVLSLEQELNIPVFGMIEAGIKAYESEVEAQENIDLRHLQVVILATPGTVRSQAYQLALNQKYPNLKVLAFPCPIFVPLVEMGWESHLLVPQLVEAQLLEDKENDWWNSNEMKHTIYLLGCTHYPMMRESIISGLERLSYHSFSCIDGAQSVAHLLKETLEFRGLLRQAPEGLSHYAYLTDDPIHSQSAVDLALRFWQNRGGVGSLQILNTR